MNTTPTTPPLAPIRWRRLVQLGDIAVSDNCDVHQIAALSRALAGAPAPQPRARR